MSPPLHVDLHLEVDPARRPVTGDVRGPDGAVRPFVGWLGLVAALERLVGADIDHDHHLDPQEDPHDT